MAGRTSQRDPPAPPTFRRPHRRPVAGFHPLSRPLGTNRRRRLLSRHLLLPPLPPPVRPASHGGGQGARRLPGGDGAGRRSGVDPEASPPGMDTLETGADPLLRPGRRETAGRADREAGRGSAVSESRRGDGSGAGNRREPPCPRRTGERRGESRRSRGRGGGARRRRAGGNVRPPLSDRGLHGPVDEGGAGRRRFPHPGPGPLRVGEARGRRLPHGLSPHDGSYPRVGGGADGLFAGNHPGGGVADHPGGGYRRGGVPGRRGRRGGRRGGWAAGLFLRGDEKGSLGRVGRLPLPGESPAEPRAGRSGRGDGAAGLDGLPRRPER